MFLAYFVSREDEKIMMRFNELARASLGTDVSNSGIAEIIQEMAKNKRHTEIQQRTSDEFCGFFESRI